MNCEPMLPPLFGKQEVGIQRVKKHFPRYRVPIWSLWPNIRFLPLIVAEKNVHICSMCIKSNQVSKQEVGIRRVQKRFPQYGIPIWSLWPNIRFPVINSCLEKCNKISKQDPMGPKNASHDMGYLYEGYWPNIRFLPSSCLEIWAYVKCA